MRKNSFLIFAGLLILLEILFYKDFIFGDKLFIFYDLSSDSYISHYPNYVFLNKAFAEGIPQWNFAQGLGSNSYPFCFEPVAFIIMSFYKGNEAYGMIWIQLIYTFLAGISFYSFLKNLSFLPETQIIGGILYAFSSYMVLYGSWCVNTFPQDVFHFGLLLFAISDFIKNKRPYFYIIAIFLISIQQPFNLYFSAILTLLFSFITLIQTNFEQSLNQLSKKWFYINLKFSLLGILGIGLSGFLFFSNLNQLLNSPRGSEFSLTQNLSSNSISFASFVELKTTFLRLFSTNSEGNAIQFNGFYNYIESPVIYSSLLTLILLPVFFIFANKKEKWLHASIILIFICLFSIPYFRHAFWLFTGDYYRFLSLFFIIFTLFTSLKSLDYGVKNLENSDKNVLFLKLSKIQIISITTTFLFLIYILFNKNNDLANPGIFVMLCFSGVYIWLLSKGIQYKYGLILVVCLEVLIFNNSILSERKVLNQADLQSKKGYNDFTVDALNYLDKKDSSFYRIEKDYFSGISQYSSFSDSKIQNYKGSKSYHSFHSIHFIRFLNALGLIQKNNEHGTRWVSGVLNSPLALRLCNVKYFLTKHIIPETLSLQMYQIEQFGNVKILQVNHFLPLGITYENFILNKDFNKFSAQNRQMISLQAISLKDKNNQLNHFQADSNNLKILILDFAKEKLIEDTLKITQHNNNLIQGNISLKKPKCLFLAIPFDEGWNLKVNGKDTKIEIAFGGMMAVNLNAGNHLVELTFQDPYIKIGSWISAFSLLILVILFYFNFKTKTNA